MPDLNWLFPGTVVQPTGPQPMQNPGGMGLMPAAPAMLPPNAMIEEDMTVSYPTRFPNDTYYGNNMQSAGGAAIANPALVNQGGGRFEEDGGVSYPRTYQGFMAPQRTMPTPVPPPPSPLTQPTKPGPSLPPYITDPGFAAPPYRPPFNQQQSPFPAPPKPGY